MILLYGLVQNFNRQGVIGPAYQLVAHLLCSFNESQLVRRTRLILDNLLAQLIYRLAGQHSVTDSQQSEELVYLF